MLTRCYRAAKTKELGAKIQEKEKGDLLDFRLDGGISAQTFEGVDYSDKELRDHLRMLAADSIGKRERRPPPTSYNPIIISKKSMVVNNRRIKLPKCLRIPQMEDHHFYNRERLLELGKLEFETYAALREENKVPPKEFLEKKKTLLPDELGQEKLELLAEGFGSWTRSQYYAFVKAAAKFGREDISGIANEMDMPEDEIAVYSRAFWQYGPTELKSEWDRVAGNIERGEKKLAKQKKLEALLTKFVSTFDNPREDMVFANRGTTHFSLEQDRALLCAVDKHGYGNWESVREDIRTDSRLKFQHSAQGMTVQAIGKRVDYRMRQMERELEARSKVMKNRRPPNVAVAHKALEAIKAMDFFDVQSTQALLDGGTPPALSELGVEARQVMEDRLKEREAAIFRLREIEVQVGKCMDLAHETREAIYRGDQYVNYSTITLKAGGPAVPKDEKGQLAIKFMTEHEGRINEAVLKIAPCGVCETCTTSNTRLCERRLEVRNRMLNEGMKEFERTGGRKPKKRKADKDPSSSAKKAKPTLSKSPAKKPEAGVKRVTSQGNKRMSIPEELMPEFCRRIGAYGTSQRPQLISKFIEDNPSISNRQATLKFTEITVRQRPAHIPKVEKKGPGRAFLFYLRPCFYKHLAPSERPENWEQYAAEDLVKWEEEKTKGKDKAADEAVEVEATEVASIT